MADESGEHRDALAERSGQRGGSGGKGQDSRASSRRRIIVTGLLTPPAVITLGSRSARAQPTPKSGPTKSMMMSAKH